MAKTYLDILNVALIDANEVQLNETTFLSARGIQAFAKEAVNRALMDMANECTEWEWLKNDTVLAPSTVTTSDGTQWYDFTTLAAGQDPYSKVDFDSFFLTATDINQGLSRITYQEWDGLFREIDEADGATGQPHYVIETDEKNKFGLSPVPDGTYTVHFNSWVHASALVNALDEIPFPDQYYNVLVARVRYYLWDYKDDQNKASRADNEYKYGINRMKERLSTPEPVRMRFI